MAPESRGVVHATQVWLQSSWHVQVPFDWLEACVEWLQEEAGGGGQLSQQHINQQVLDQWLQTDLRVLGHPVLPDGLSQAQKTELSGTFIVQVDSLLDISQPAYGQLQKWRGKDCSNEEVSAVTQTTQKPWEAKPTRMLLLQVTDGVQSLEAMEYQPIAALNTSLRPGLKLQLQGQMVCRLGVLLLGPQNVKVLGGEVEDLMERNKQGRVLCRALGLPEEEHQTEGAQQEVNEGDPPAPQQGDHGFEDFDIDDEELLVSLEAQEELDRAEHQHSLDTGYGTLTEDSSVSYRGSSVRSQASTASSRRESSSQRQSLAQASGRSLGQGNHRRNDQDYSALVNPPSSTLSSQHNATSHNAADENFPDEDFDDLVLDELDGVVLQESSIQTRGQPDSRHDNRRLGHNGAAPGRREAVTSDPSFHLRASIEAVHLPDDRDFMDDDLDFCFPEETEEIENRGKDVQGGFKEHDRTLGTFQTLRASTSDASVLQEGISLGSKNDAPQSLCQARDGKRSVPSKSEASDFNYRLSIQSSARPADKSSTKTAPVSESIPQAISHVPRAAESAGLSLEKETPRDGTITAPSLTSPPFTYLCLLRGKTPRGTVIRMKAFIVTLLGKLTSNTGAWRVFATISDGTGYLDVELSDQVLSAMLGFSVAEKGAMKRDPSRRAELNAGMRRCQEELVDMCCVMTVLVEAPPKKAVVLKVDPVTEEDLRALEHRMKKRKR